MDIIMLPVENLQKISCGSRPNPFSRVHLKTFRLRPGFELDFCDKNFFNDFVESSLKVFCKISSVKKNSFKQQQKICVEYWILWSTP